MHKCVLCGVDTILLINGVPICVECDEELEMKTPQYPLLAKTEDAIVPRDSVRSIGGTDAISRTRMMSHR